MRVKERDERGRGDRAVGVRAQFGQLGPVDVAIKVDADPAAALDRRKALRSLNVGTVARSGERCAPEVAMMRILPARCSSIMSDSASMPA